MPANRLHELQQRQNQAGPWCRKSVYVQGHLFKDVFCFTAPPFLMIAGLRRGPAQAAASNEARDTLVMRPRGSKLLAALMAGAFPSRVNISPVEPV